jgi:hypothetical protein
MESIARVDKDAETPRGAVLDLVSQKIAAAAHLTKRYNVSKNIG